MHCAQYNGIARNWSKNILKHLPPSVLRRAACMGIIIIRGYLKNRIDRIVSGMVNIAFSSGVLFYLIFFFVLFFSFRQHFRAYRMCSIYMTL